MRDHYTLILKDFFHKKLTESRKELHLSQEEMAHRLSMASRSYLDLEHGKSGCSGLTLAFYLLYLCPDPQKFLDELKEELEHDGRGKKPL